MIFKKRKYKEAYLEMEQNKIKEKEKTRREELGEQPESKEVIRRNMNETGSRQEPLSLPNSNRNNGFHEKNVKDVQNLPYEEEEDSREAMEKPKSRLVWLLLLFLLLLSIMTTYYFIPKFNNLLKYEVDYSTLFSSWNRNESTDVVETKNDEIDAESTEIETQVDETQSSQEPFIVTEGKEIVTSVKEAAPAMLEGTKEVVAIANDTVTMDTPDVYARTHRLIMENTRRLRDTTSRYIDKRSSLVELTSASDKIKMDMDKAQFLLESVEDKDLYSNLVTRVNRLTELGEDVENFTRGNAAEKINDYLKLENTESGLFISDFKVMLEQQQISYSLEKGIFHLNK